MTLILWKAPFVDEPDEAARLLEPFYENSDESAFEPSADVTKVAEELLRRFPDGDDAPWADSPPYDAERVLLLTIRWSADDAVLDAIQELAREHGLILYDPQGPVVHLPTDPPDSGPTSPLKLTDHLTFVLMGVGFAAVFWLGWRISNPVLHWLLMIVGGFLFSVVVFLLYILWSDRRKPAR